MELSKYEHFIFDLDGTLTESRSPINLDLYKKLVELKEKGKTVTVISGATVSQIREQLTPKFADQLLILGQSGNDFKEEGEDVWKNSLEVEDVHGVLLHLSDILDEFGHQNIEEDKLEIRGGQVSYSLVGHNAPREDKLAYDPDGRRRNNLLVKIPFQSESMMVRVGGTTCLDYTKTNWGKRGNLSRLMRSKNWKKSNCVYFGDQIYEGGNDWDVRTILDTVSVENPTHTLVKLYEVL